MMVTEMILGRYEIEVTAETADAMIREYEADPNQYKIIRVWESDVYSVEVMERNPRTRVRRAHIPLIAYAVGLND